MPGLTGKVALITGAGTKEGFGRAIALRLARDGADSKLRLMCQQGNRKNTMRDKFGACQRLRKSVEPSSTLEGYIDLYSARTSQKGVIPMK